MGANSKPLEDLERRLNTNENIRLQEIGNELLKECRELEYGEESSTVEYFVISTQSLGDAAYMEAVILTAVEALRGSLYTDVKLCDANDVIEAVQTIYKIKGININNLLNTQTNDFRYKVVNILDTITDNSSTETEDQHQSDYEEFMREYAEVCEVKPQKNLVAPISKIVNKISKRDITEELEGESYEEFVPIIIDDDDEIDENDEIFDMSDSDNLDEEDSNNNNRNNQVQQKMQKIQIEKDKASSKLDTVFNSMLGKSKENTEDVFSSLMNSNSDNDEELDKMFDEFIPHQDKKSNSDTEDELDKMFDDFIPETKLEESDDPDEELDKMFDEFIPETKSKESNDADEELDKMFDDFMSSNDEDEELDKMFDEFMSSDESDDDADEELDKMFDEFIN
jgi:hypothetical protein